MRNWKIFIIVVAVLLAVIVLNGSIGFEFPQPKCVKDCAEYGGFLNFKNHVLWGYECWCKNGRIW